MAAIIDGAPDEDGADQTLTPLDALRLQMRRIAALFDSVLGRGVAAMLAASESDSEVAKAFRNRFITARREEGRALLAAAVARDDLDAGDDPEMTFDLLYGQDNRVCFLGG